MNVARQIELLPTNDTVQRTRIADRVDTIAKDLRTYVREGYDDPRILFSLAESLSPEDKEARQQP